MYVVHWIQALSIKGSLTLFPGFFSRKGSGNLTRESELAPSQKLPLLSKIRIALMVSVHSLKSIIPERTSAGGVLSVMLCAHANSETSQYSGGSEALSESGFAITCADLCSGTNA